MDIGRYFEESLNYTRDALWEKWTRWLLLIVSAIIFPLIIGYTMEIYRGKKPAPEPQDWVKLFIDGIKLLIVGLIYAIPVIIVGIVFIGGSLMLFMSGDSTAAMAAIGSMVFGLLIVFVLAVITGIFSTMAAVRFSRTDNFGDAFDIGWISSHIGEIGWVQYIVALVVMIVVVGIAQIIIGVIPVIGWLLVLILAPAFSIFEARYITQIYDSVPV